MASKKAVDVQVGDQVSLLFSPGTVTRTSRTATSGGCRVSIFVKNGETEVFFGTFRGSTKIKVAVR